MKPKLMIAFSAVAITIIAFSCSQLGTNENKNAPDSTATVATAFGGYESQLKWGEHLVIICGCNDCHTPKKMGAMGPEPDMSLMLSGHPAQMPPPPITQKEAAAKGLAVTQTLTAWVGAWGITYAVNITSDSTGIGNWKEDQFIKALREGKWMGLDNTRPILPPMPWQDFKVMSDHELKAIFAYLKSTPPIHNIVPAAMVAMPPGK